MSEFSNTPLSVEQSCALVASTLSEGRREGARLVSGERREFSVSIDRRMVEVPFPGLAQDWLLRTLTCGVALQCAPSKDALARYPLAELTSRQLKALTHVEGQVALGWVAARWPGLLEECQRHLLGVTMLDAQLGGEDMMDRAFDMARSADEVRCPPLLGRLTTRVAKRRGLMAGARRVYGRMPWSSRNSSKQPGFSMPVGGDGGLQNPNLPPPSRPEDDEIEIRTDYRVGIPYPEWNAWTTSFLPRHVAVVEVKHPTQLQSPQAVSPEIRKWFEQRTHRTMTRGLEDGSDIDIDRYVDHRVDTLSGHVSQARVFRDLVPSYRDVTTAVLLDGSSSLGVQQGRVFGLELQCADALSRAMTLARERHGIFVFSGNTRHRVEVRCLKDFDEPRFVAPSGLGLIAGGYTRLGAPLRHLTTRLLAQPSERRLLIVIGDGLMSDEGYEGRYAWADVAHALEEAHDAAVSVYYIGVGPTRVDPLPEVFGPRRSRRIRRIEELPHVLADVHRELVNV